MFIGFLCLGCLGLHQLINTSFVSQLLHMIVHNNTLQHVTNEAWLLILVDAISIQLE